MATLKEDIKTQTDWIRKAFQADGYNLDYTIKSFIEFDRFFQKHSKNGKPEPGGRLSQNLGPILFSIGSYIGETFIKIDQGAEWITDDNDPQGEFTASVKLSDGSQCWPMQRAMNRFKNGFEDSIYPYGYQFAKEFHTEQFDQDFWAIGNDEDNSKKPWWKFW